MIFWRKSTPTSGPYRYFWGKTLSWKALKNIPKLSLVNLFLNGATVDEFNIQLLYIKPITANGMGENSKYLWSARPRGLLLPWFTHFMSLVSFYTPWKHHKTRSFVFRGYGKRLVEWKWVNTWCNSFFQGLKPLTTTVVIVRSSLCFNMIFYILHA